MSIGIPVKLLYESVGHIVTVELKSGDLYRGKLVDAEDNMNMQMTSVTVTRRDGRVQHLERTFFRGSQCVWFIVPDMLRNAPMFKRIGHAAPTTAVTIGVKRGRNTGPSGPRTISTRGRAPGPRR